MNITHLLGNGFDLNLGLKTAYKDFYSFYQNTSTNKDLKSELIEEIKQNKNEWSDFEFNFGKFTNKTDSPKDFINLCKDVSYFLKSYIKEQEDRLDIDDELPKVFINNLIHPEECLLPKYKNKIIAYRNNNLLTSHVVNTITFNYTKSLEIIIDKYKDKNTLPVINGATVGIEEIEHIHGKTDDNSTIILGVNDESQIDNKILANDLGVKDYLIKSQSNYIIGEETEDKCKKIIKNSNLICLYGLSLGDTDKLWWYYIGEVFSNSNLMIIYFVQDFDIIDKKGFGVIERKNKELLINKMGIESITVKDQQRIIVAPSTYMFKNNHSPLLMGKSMREEINQIKKKEEYNRVLAL